MILRQLRKAESNVIERVDTSIAAALRSRRYSRHHNRHDSDSIDARWHQSSRLDPRSRRPALHDAARRPRRRRHQGRAPGIRATRRADWGPPFDDEGRSAYYLSINRNKLGMRPTSTSAAIARFSSALIADADVVVDNFRRGMLERRGISPDEWCARRPELVWCTITGFGPGSDGRATTSSRRPSAGGWRSPASRTAIR